MHFEVVSDREVAVDGIGVLYPNESVTPSDDALRLFEALHGYSLANANFPEFVQVTAVIEKEGE